MLPLSETDRYSTGPERPLHNTIYQTPELHFGILTLKSMVPSAVSCRFAFIALRVAHPRLSRLASLRPLAAPGPIYVVRLVVGLPRPVAAKPKTGFAPAAPEYICPELSAQISQKKRKHITKTPIVRTPRII